MASIPQGIKVYCRLRPLMNKDIAIKHEIRTSFDEDELDILYKNTLNSSSTNTNTYQFNRVFDERETQSSIFENVAVPIIDKFVSGMNGTIFSYGQTCSGKTHTIMGSKNDPGIIPRTISYIMNKSTMEEFPREYEISYIEVYNEMVYDLLPKNKIELIKNKAVSFTNSVKLVKGKSGDISFKNVNVYGVKTVYEALELIELGHTKRRVSSTTLNAKSSRSHCICTISFNNTAKRNSSAMKNKTKLNLVDLAGSERDLISTVKQKTLTESRAINLSLHYLNVVINILGNPKRQSYVPYRNSIITSILKGSLGSDCATAMIATIVLNKKCIMESLSTCRHSKQVAGVKQHVKNTLNSNPISISKKNSESFRKNERIIGERIKYLENRNKKLLKMEAVIKCLQNTSVTQPSITEGYREEEKMLKKRIEQLENKLINKKRNCKCRLERNGLGCVGDGTIGFPEIDVMAPLVTESGDHNLHSMTKVIGGNGADDGLGLNYKITDVDNIVSAPDGIMAQDDVNENIKSYRRRGTYLTVFSSIVLFLSTMVMFMLLWSNNPDVGAVNVLRYNINQGSSSSNIVPIQFPARRVPVGEQRSDEKSWLCYCIIKIDESSAVVETSYNLGSDTDQLLLPASRQ